MVDESTNSVSASIDEQRHLLVEETEKAQNHGLGNLLSRRVSSIRDLLLGEEQKGERLKFFALQMGLPHDLVVAHFKVTLPSPPV